MEASAVTSFSPFCAAIFLICKEPQLCTRPSFSWFSRLKKLGSDNGGQRMLPLIARAKKGSEKTNTHTYIPKPDEESGPFPEAVLLKKKVVKEDGRVEPEFADAEEEKLYRFLKLELESNLNLQRIRHYEVMYLIHEDRVQEVDDVVFKIKAYIKEKKGRIWRLNNWGLRRLCYEIKKARKANYILMNFELEAKWINGFKNMLDKDERIIRHMVSKKHKAITKACPPPTEFHDIRAAQGIPLDYREEWLREEEEEGGGGGGGEGGEEEEEEVDDTNDDDANDEMLIPKKKMAFKNFC